MLRIGVDKALRLYSDISPDIEHGDLTFSVGIITHKAGNFEGAWENGALPKPLKLPCYQIETKARPRKSMEFDSEAVLLRKMD